MQPLRPDALSDAIEEAISGSTHLWFEGLGERLTRYSWTELAQIGHTPDRYGTHRFLTNDPTAERRIAGSVPVRVGEMPPVIIEVLPCTTARPYGGLTFAGRAAAAAATVPLEAAFKWIERVPTLSHSIAWLLRSLHVLVADPEFDVSHSDPEVPFSIFVSVPRDDEAHGSLRLAEQIVHECMHLQLTLMERAVPMVAVKDFTLFSPWQQCPRSAQGVLHGLYVFGVVDAFLGVLQPGLESTERAFVDRRKSQIAHEIASVKGIIGALNPHGRRLFTRVLNRF